MDITRPAARAYSPKEYGFIGFLFGLVPLFLMSWSNSKVLSPGEPIRRKTTIFFVGWCAMLVGYFLVITWAAFQATAGLKSYLQANPQAAYALSRGSESAQQALGQISEVRLARTITSNTGTIFFALQIILLIAFVYSSNRVQLPVFRRMKEEGEVGVKGPALPVLIGLAVAVVLYFLPPWYIQMMANVFTR